MSEAMVSRRAGRIDGLSERELHSLATFLSGWTPAGVDCALDSADRLRAAGVPEGAL